MTFVLLKLQETYKRGFTVRLALATLLVLGGTAPVWAHIGSPYPIMENGNIGPLKVDV